VALGVGAGLVLVDHLAVLGSAPDRMALDIVGHWSVPAIVCMQGRSRVVARPEAARRAGVENVEKFAMTWT